MLGGLAVVAGNGSVASEQRRRLALLALLASARDRGMTRDRLIALLSPESSEESARHSLHQLLYFLRKQLTTDAFLGTDPLRLNPAVVTSDVFEFEEALDRGELARAAALYRGPFLDGFHLNVSTFEEWLASERQRLAARYGTALRRLASECEAAGDRRSSIAWWRQLTSLDPLSGSAALGLMRTLTAAGDGSAALRHARLHSSHVQKELGSRADAEVEAFAERLQRRELSGDIAYSARRHHQNGQQNAGGLRSAEVSSRRVHRLALLPLRSAEHDASARFVAEGLTREMISSLTRAGVAVIGYESVAGYGSQAAPLREIVRVLDVDAIATGTLLRSGDGIELALEVANPHGETLWLSSTTVESGAISRLAGDAVQALAGWALGDTLPRRRMMASGSVTPADAYTSYLLGMRETYRCSAVAMRHGLDLLEQAIVQDDSFALAYAGLGFALTVAVDYAVLPADEVFRRADPIIARALALDANLALAHLARARLLQLRDWNWQEAEVEYRTAIDLEPNALSYQTFGWFLEWYVGRAEEGVAMGERAVQIEPSSAVARHALAWRYRGADRLDRAADEARIGLALDPTSIDGYWVLAEVFLRRGDLTQAEEYARRYVDAGGDVPANSTTLGEILARTGRTSEARAYAARLALLAHRDGPSLVALARTEMSLGNRDRALRLLEQAVRQRVFTIPFQPYWDPLRSDPRFQAVVRAQGLA
jgi:DNA-binding SARP family transcriptional activator/Tfp pilus assembly protein PilF